jgi:hypothetical protein
MRPPASAAGPENVGTQTYKTRSAPPAISCAGFTDFSPALCEICVICGRFGSSVSGYLHGRSNPSPGLLRQPPSPLGEGWELWAPREPVFLGKGPLFQIPSLRRGPSAKAGNLSGRITPRHTQDCLCHDSARAEIPAGRNLRRPGTNISSINRQFVNAGIVYGPTRASLPLREGCRVKSRTAAPSGPSAREHARPGGSRCR